jgi:hypothetical protein
MANLIADLNTPRHGIHRARVLETIAKVMTNASADNGVLRWNMGNIVPADITELAAEVLPSLNVDVEATARARDAHLTAFLDDYVEAQQNKTDEQRREEAFEMLAAFGPGQTVVNVITGEKVRT